MVSAVGYCPAAMRDLKESTSSLRTAGVWLAWATRLENEAAEVVKLDADCSVEAGAVAGADGVVALIVAREVVGMENLLICISLTCFIGPISPLLSGFLSSGEGFIRFTGHGSLGGAVRR